MHTLANLLLRVTALESGMRRSAAAVSRRVARAGTPLVVACCTAFVVLALPALALAQEESDVDGRLEGYSTKVAMEGGGTGLTWIAFFVLAVVGVSALFKSAKRTHLD
jgi:hypothetical protein